jgi:predicted HTH domain antitoxin
MNETTVNYLDNLAQDVRTTPAELEAEVRLMAALKMFELGKLSSGKAAELAGLSRVAFLEACGRYHVSIFNYADEDVESEMQSDLDAVESRA